VAISRHTLGLALQQGLREVVVIHPCLPSSSFPEHDTDAPLPPSWEQASGHALRVLYFGRLIPRKGSLWFAREVMPLLSEPALFFVVGDSADGKYKAAIEGCARTHRLGRVDGDRLAMMIRQADLVVMPNIAVPDQVDVEGFGLVAVETSALGGRLLAARIDGITDAVVDGVTGTLLPAGEATAWAELIERSRNDATGVLPDAATASTETRKRYARSIQAQAVIALLDDCASSRNTRTR
jgi:phosphatidylinositol alpha-1,6-mannosyltransferase